MSKKRSFISVIQMNFKKRVLRKYKTKIRKFWNFIKRENFDRIFILIIILTFISSLIFSTFEKDVTFSDGLWWTIVTLTTVGYGDIIPKTSIGRGVAFIDMIIGIGVLAIFSAKVASILVQRKIMENSGLQSFKFENHIILCEWNYRQKTILEEIRLTPNLAEKPIILIADLEQKPINDPYLYFVKGNVSDQTLNRANLYKASTVIILGDDRCDPNTRDAKVVLATLTVESINDQVYTIVELVDEAYVTTCKRAKADEIIVGSKISSWLIANAALNYGISQIFSELLNYKEGNQIHLIPVNLEDIGKSFLDLLIKMKKTQQILVIGVKNGQKGQLISNPPIDYIIQSDDYLVIIA